MLELFAAEATAGGGGSEGYWHLAMILAAIGLLGLFARLRKARRDPLPKTAKEYREMDKTPDRYRSAADKAMVDMLEAASALTAEMNTKCRVLNRLVKQAEEQADRLEALLEETNGGPATRRRGATPPNAEAPADAGDAARQDRRRGTDGSGSELFERMSVLMAEGKTVAEIAKATNLSTIEVTFAMQHLVGTGSVESGDGGESEKRHV